MRKSHTSLQHHTIFANNPWMAAKRAFTPLKLQSAVDISQQKKYMNLHINMPRKDTNNWLKQLEKSYPRKQSISKQGKKKKMLIKQIEDGLPHMKVESAISAGKKNKQGQISFNQRQANKFQRRSQSPQITKQKHDLDDVKIRKISVLSIDSSKSIHQQMSPQLNTKNWLKSIQKIPNKNTIFMPVTNKAPNIISNQNLLNNYDKKVYDQQKQRQRRKKQLQRQIEKERQEQKRVKRKKEKEKEIEQLQQQFNNSHYNNKKYENKRFYTDTEVYYEKQLDFLKEELKKSEIIINSMKIKELEGEISKLKEKDKLYQKIIGSLAQEKKQKQKLQGEPSNGLINKKSSLKRANSEEKQKQVKFLPQQSKIKRSESSGKGVILESQQRPQKRSKTQMKQQPQKNAKKVSKPNNFHVLADHQRQIQTQKQFILIDPKKTRQKLNTCYNQLKKQNQPPQISINSFRIPKLPATHPQSTHSLQTYIQLSNQLCKCLNFQIEEMSIVIRKYKNCISFKIVETGEQVVWGFDGKLYVGGWKEDGEAGGYKEGQGMQFTPNYCFKGEFKDNKKSGKGVTQFYNGNVFEGQWKDNKMQGKGTYFQKSSLIYYQGTWEKGQLRGRGVIKYNKKHYYIGQINNFTKSGKGTQFFENGSIYEGNFEKGMQSGYGIQYSHDGIYYVGNFKNSQRNGIGLLLTNQFSQKQDAKQSLEFYYYGDFVNGSRCGYGIQRTPQNSYYLGYFLNNLAHGPGILQNQPISNANNTNDMVKLTGIWKNGKVVVRNKNVQPSQKSQSKDFSQAD